MTMRLPADTTRPVETPEYRQALQELIKYEIQALIERLSATGEEAVVITASVIEGTSSQFGSLKVQGFLNEQANLCRELLSFCNDDCGPSSADELCNYGDDMNPATPSALLPSHSPGKFHSPPDDSVRPQSSPLVQFTAHRTRERTSSKRLSLSTQENVPEPTIDEVSQNSELSVLERADSASSVSSFIEAQDDQSNLQCRICSRNFRSYKTLSQHVRLHMAKSYKCGVCGKIFSMKKRYQSHIKMHNKGKLFDCGICDKTFTDRHSWKRHREHHLSIRKFSCNLCGKAFYEKYSLRVHQTSHFYSATKSDKSADPGAGYSCHVCQKLCKTKTALKNHILTHSAKKHACEFCNKRFSLKYSYIRHRRIHTGEKPYKCGACDRSFSDGSAWSKHVRTHSGIKPYSCDVCSKSFFDKSGCRTHRKTHGGKSIEHGDVERRNFKMVTLDTQKVNYDKKSINNDVSLKKLSYEITGSDMSAFNEDLELEIDVNDKKCVKTKLDLDFNSDVISPIKETDERQSKSEQLTGLIDSVELDVNFQTDFVERNMPSKPIESDNELISTTFPDDPDLLVSEAAQETEKTRKDINQHTDDGNGNKFYESSPKKQIRKSRRRTTASGKIIPESPSKCKICHKQFKYDSLLKQHLSFHCMMKLYKCRYCGKQLSTKHSLVRHERIHVGDRPYQCYICQKTFADNYGCIRHIKHHFNNDSRSPLVMGSLGRNNFSEVNTSSQSSGPDTVISDVPSSVGHSSIQLHDAFTKSSGITPKLNEPDKILITARQDKIYSPDLNDLTGGDKLFENKNGGHVENTSRISQSSGREAENKDSQQLYKCYLCSALFSTEQLCIQHIQQSCPLKQKTEVNEKNDETVTTGGPTEKNLRNLYQCSMCSQVFDDALQCQKHVNQECLKSSVTSECAVQSILQDTLPYTGLADIESSEPIPQLPFPDVDSSEHFMTMDGSDMMVLPTGQGNPVIHESPEKVTESPFEQSGTGNTQKTTLPFVSYNQIVQQSSSISKLGNGSSSSPDLQFTGLIQKPVMEFGQNKFIVLNKGLSLVTTAGVGAVTGTMTSKSASKAGTVAAKDGSKVDSDVSERTCSICSKVFTNKHILKQHTLIHMEKKFGCKYCMKKFHNKYGRDRHERIHTGEKPFSCPNCRKAFSDNSTYRKHTRVCCSGK